MTAVAGQLWDNMEQLPSLSSRCASDVATNEKPRDLVTDEKPVSGDLVTSDYVLAQLECLAQILSHCLLDPSSSQLPGLSLSSGLSSGSGLAAPASHQSSMVTNLVHVLGGASHAGAGE